MTGIMPGPAVVDPDTGSRVQPDSGSGGAGP